MYIFNVSFVCEPSEEDSVIEVLRHSFAGLPVGEVTLMRVADVPGAPDYNEQARTLSVQVKFDTFEECSSFGHGRLPHLVQGITDRFGNRVMPFSTILEILPIE